MIRVCLLTLSVVALLPLTTTAADNVGLKPPSFPVLVQADGLKWAAGPPALPKGAQIAVLYGDPAKEGPFVYRLKLPAGYKVPPHTHPNDEDVTVLSGTLRIGMGDTLDEAIGEAVKAGGYLHMPRGMRHYAMFSEDTIIQLSGTGPTDITYVNPTDDPRNY